MSNYPDRVQPEERSKWATYCYDRKEQWKVHSSEGLANTSIANFKPSCSMAKYLLGRDGWVKVWEYEPPLNCPRCEGPAVQWRIDREDERMSVLNARVCCATCRMNQDQAARRADIETRERAELERLKAQYE